MLPFGSPTRVGSRSFGTGQWSATGKSAQISLSKSNSVASSNNAADDGQYHFVRAATGRLAGKYHFEIGAMFAPSGNNEFVGPATISNAADSVAGGYSDGVYWRPDGTIALNADDGGGSSNLITANTPMSWTGVMGARLVYEIDFGAARLWAAIVKGGAMSNWNNSGSANPATNTGGFDIGRIFSGPGDNSLYPAAMARLMPDSYTCYFDGHFLVPPSSGFSNWG